MLGGTLPLLKSSPSPHQILQLTDVFLENAYKTDDNNVAVMLCHHAGMALSQAKAAAKKTDTTRTDLENQAMRERIANAYLHLGKLLENKGYEQDAKTFYKKCEKLGGTIQDPGQFVPGPTDNASDTAAASSADVAIVPSTGMDATTVPMNIFIGNVRPPIMFKPPGSDERLGDTQQLACCLGLLKDPISTEDIVDSAVRDWLQTTQSDSDEQERLEALANDVLRAFKRDEIKDTKAMTEVLYLAPFLGKDDFQYLLKEFCFEIERSKLLDIHKLGGLARLIQGANHDHLNADDLVRILQLLSSRLKDTHRQSPSHRYELTRAVSCILDAMADVKIKGLDRETIHEPLSSYLNKLKNSEDAYLVYQAAYAYQALLYVPDDELLWQAVLRRTGKVIKGVSGLVSVVKGLDLSAFIESLKDIQQGFAGVSDVVQHIKTAVLLAQSGQSFLECLKGGLSFSRKCAWYSALRGADTFICGGQLAKFRKLVCEAPCRRDQAFQWGICQRLGELAANTTWDLDTRKSAVAFLGEIYQKDDEWGYHATVKQLTLNILMQLSLLSMDDMEFVDTMLRGLGNSGDTKKKNLYRKCREDGPDFHPLKITLPTIGSPSLLDRVQGRLDIEGTLRHLKKERLKERGNAVYIPPNAKPALQAPDEEQFPLMETVKGTLASNQKVFLLLGDSGSGKSTFIRELECQLWQEYKKNGSIPLHINLPAIEKPEHDMIAKQLRKAAFTEPQIRELKLYRKFILICDGYDESQQTHNLYTSNRLNEPNGWNAKMIITCRSEYIGVDYRDRFRPGDHNDRVESGLFREAVTAPFSLTQVQDYIDQYVTMYQPLWEADQYKQVLDRIPSLKELVKNPFLMSLSLEVLPRMTDPSQNLLNTHITRVALYDQFVAHWIERGKKRLGEKNLSPHAREAFEDLSEEGFTQNGVNFLKRLSVAIYKEQGGQPVVRYSHEKDSNSWKEEFFSRGDQKRLLREVCPLIRSSNQYRFIHRSLLEYGLSLVIFDPQDWNSQDLKEATAPPTLYTARRRGSASSDWSFIIHDTVNSTAVASKPEPDLDSPLVWRSFVEEPSVLQFLEERVQQEPIFKQLLLDYIEHSKTDKKWRTAAANAITTLVRAGVQFIGADLREIQIPGADLSHGVFDSAQLQSADLRNVNLRGVCLQQANLNNAWMAGVQFGEFPYLKQKHEVESIAYSPNGKTFVVGQTHETVSVYLTSNFEILWTAELHCGISALSYSPSGDQLAFGAGKSLVELWDVETGEHRHSLVGHRKPVLHIVYSRQGDRLASASQDMTVRLWNLESRECLHVLTGHTQEVHFVIFSPIGNQLASRDKEKKIRLWDVQSGACLHTLEGPSKYDLNVVYSPQGNQVASVVKKTFVQIWDVETGRPLRTLKGHSNSIRFIAYSPQGNQLASASMDKTIILWNVESGTRSHTLKEHTSYVYELAYSPRGNLLASCSGDFSVRLWDPESGTCLRTLSGHKKGVWSVVFSPDGDQLASRCSDAVRLWDVKIGALHYALHGHSTEVNDIKCSPNMNQLASCSKDRMIRLWDVETGSRQYVLSGKNGEIYSIAYSPKGDTIAAASRDKKLWLWDVDSGECRMSLTGHTDGIRKVVYSPKGNYIATRCANLAMRLWNVETNVCDYEIPGSGPHIQGVSFSPCGNRMAVVVDGFDVWLMDVNTKECLHVLTSDFSTLAVTFSPRGNQVATASYDKTAKLWDVDTGRCMYIMIGHLDTLTGVFYSPQGDQIISVSSDETMRLWCTETGRCIRVISSCATPMAPIVFSNQGNLVAFTENDGTTVMLHDIASGQCRRVIQSLEHKVKCLLWSPHGSPGYNYLIAGWSDGPIMMWEVMDDVDRCRLHWRTTKAELIVEGVLMQDVRGLSQLNKQLLEQRGAIAPPIHAVRRRHEVDTVTAPESPEPASTATEEP